MLIASLRWKKNIYQFWLCGRLYKKLLPRKMLKYINNNDHPPHIGTYTCVWKYNKKLDIFMFSYMLVLKENAPIMLTENLNSSNVLFNGLMIISRGFNNDVIHAEITHVFN